MKAYHLSNNLYKDIRPLAFQTGGTKHLNKMRKQGYNNVEKYSFEVNLFLKPFTLKHINQMVEAGFNNWKMDEAYLYTIDLDRLMVDVDYKYIAVTSTPQQTEYDNKHWDAFSKKNEKLSDKDWRAAVKEYKERREFYLANRYGIKEFKTVEEFKRNPNLRSWMDFDKQFEYNLEHGNKRQYASYITHIQIGALQPLIPTDVNKLK